MRTALIIGGGVVGLTAALQLQQQGLAVTLVDPEALPRPASWGNAGHIAIEQVAPLASIRTLLDAPRHLLSHDGLLSLPIRDLGAWAPFGLELIGASMPSRFAAGQLALTHLLREALPAWRRLTSGLRRPDLLRENGHYLVWEKAATARNAQRVLLSREAPTVTYRDPDPKERDRIAELIGREPAGILHCEGSAQVTHIAELMAALQAAFVSAGGAPLRTTAIALQIEGGRTVAVLKDRTTATADLVVVAAGVGSRRLLSRLGQRVPLIAERGYHLHARTHRWPEGLPSVTFEDRSLFVTPFRDGLRASSFLEFSRPDRPADPRKWRRLRAHLTELNLPAEEPLSEWMGSRPTLPDYLPAVGRSHLAPNLIYAFGHQHLGLTLAPITAELVGALALGAKPPVAVEPFDLDRFS